MLVKRFGSRKLKALEGDQPNGSFLRAYGPTTYNITSPRCLTSTDE